MTEEKKYYITYEMNVHPEGLVKRDIPEGHGAADAVVILSMLYPPDGSFSLAVPSLDGRTHRAVTDNELFKVWTLIASRLADSMTLSANKKEFARLVFEMVRTAILNTQEREKL